MLPTQARPICEPFYLAWPTYIILIAFFSDNFVPIISGSKILSTMLNCQNITTCEKSDSRNSPKFPVQHDTMKLISSFLGEFSSQYNIFKVGYKLSIGPKKNFNDYKINFIGYSGVTRFIVLWSGVVFNRSPPG